MKKQTASATPSTKSLLNYLKDGKPYAYSAGAGQNIIDRMRANYGRLYGRYQDVLQAQEEGVFEVTIRSATQTITMAVPVDSGNMVAEELFNHLAQQLGALNMTIIDQLDDEEQTIIEGGEDPRNRIIHNLCMPAAPVAPAPAKAEGDRCPFLPASTVPTPSRRPEPVPVG